MKKNLFLRLCLIMIALLSFHSCRQDLLPEKETYNNSSAFQLTSKRISLDEAKHKANLVPKINQVETNLYTESKNNLQGKTVNFGNGISIDTDDVIYLDKGPDFHSYTFRIDHENAPADAPIENLVISSRPDGTWKEVLVTYYLTPLERQNMLSGGAVDFTGKVTHEILQNGTYSSAIMQQDVMNCHLEISTYYTRCGGDEDHHNGELPDEQDGPCKTDTPSVLVVSLVRKCTVALPVDTGLGENGEGGGSGPQNGPGGLSNNPPEETTTAPNLPVRNNPCEKTKAMLAIPAVQTKIANLKQQAELPAVNPAGGEKGFKLKTDSTVEDATMTAKHEVDYGDLSGSYGAYHNHTLRGTHMLSHKDIDILLGLTTHNSTTGPANAFHGMIAAEEDGSGGFTYLNYVVRFNGTYQDAINFNFTDDELKKIKDEYRKAKDALLLDPLNINSDGFTLNKDGLQKLFFEATKLMSMQNNVILQRIDDDGVKIIQLNSDGSTTAIPCP